MTLKSELAAAIAQFRHDRELLRSAKIDGQSAGELRKLARAMFASASRALMLYSHPSNWRTGAGGSISPYEIYAEGPFTPLPGDIAWFAGGLFDHVSKGDLRGPIEDALGAHGRAGIAGQEANDIKTAALYIIRARRADIDDADPVATICNEFGVKSRTAQAWAKRHTHIDQDPLLNQNVEAVEAAMRSAGERYRQFGRGERAVLSRDRRQPPPDHDLQPPGPIVSRRDAIANAAMKVEEKYRVKRKDTRG